MAQDAEVLRRENERRKAIALRGHSQVRPNADFFELV